MNNEYQLRVIGIRRLPEYGTFSWVLADGPDDANEYLLAETFVGSDGIVYILDDDFFVYRWNGTKDESWNRLSEKQLQATELPVVYKSDVGNQKHDGIFWIYFYE